MHHTDNFASRLAQIAERPPHTNQWVSVSRSDMDAVTQGSDLLYTLGQDIVNLYFADDPTVLGYVEYGLPEVYVQLLHETRRLATHKTLMRFDFFFTRTGPKLVEVSSNPWGLISYEAHVKSFAPRAAPFPAAAMYTALCRERPGRRVGIWGAFGFTAEIAELTALLNHAGYRAELLRSPEDLSRCDIILYDIETSHLGGTLEHLVPYAPRLLPSPANEIIKRKNILPLLYRMSIGDVTLQTRLTTAQLKFLSQFLVPAHLVPSQLSSDECSGAIKEIVGIWGLQVSVLSPDSLHKGGASTKRRRSRFRKHLGTASRLGNAILQEYIQPISLDQDSHLFTEFSVICSDLHGFPFARVYQGDPEHKIGVGDGPVLVHP